MSLIEVSNIILWILVVAEGVAILALYRYHADAILTQVARSGEHGPAVGSPPPSLRAQTMLGKDVNVPDDSSPFRAIFFITGTCAVCERMLASLRHEHFAGVEERSLFVCAGSDDAVQTVIKEHGIEPGRMILDRNGSIGRRWAVVGTPFVVVLDEASRVISKCPSQNWGWGGGLGVRGWPFRLVGCTQWAFERGSWWR